MPKRSGRSVPSIPETGAHTDGAASAADIAAIIAGRHGDPFAVLGMHARADGLWVGAWLPGAQAVSVLDAGTGQVVATLGCRDQAGYFEGRVEAPAAGRARSTGRRMPARSATGRFVATAPVPFEYRLRVNWPGSSLDLDDPYRFGPLLGDMDLWWLSEGRHERPYQCLGAHPMRVDGAEGTRFAVWAPNAAAVAVIGDFNGWDATRHPMRIRASAGIWELFLPDARVGQRYKFALIDRAGQRLPDHADPYARQTELRPATASVIATALVAPLPGPVAGLRQSTDAPISIYEVHPGSWRRVPDEGGRWLDWRELADQLIPYARDQGFTHLELLPVSEHPFDGSWGYQPTGLYAPTARFGAPEDFRQFVARCHEAGLGVILDWVPAHFPEDPFGLARFDGSHLYEHADPREGRHRDWGTLIYNFGRSEVRNFLIGNARFWVEQFGVDGLRVDAVASMLYRDYSRPAGEWVPNRYGGRENLEAMEFLREMNTSLGATHPWVMTIAEESTAWPGVSRPVSAGGLGFHYKWNMGWMNDTLRYMSRDPIHRAHHQGELTFGLAYAFDEQYILPLSHDEVVHGKRSLIGRMPGDEAQAFANLRLYLGFMFAHPGKKLLFMGDEFAQRREWDHDRSLDWHLLDDPAHRGVQALVRDLNHLYGAHPALHERDARADGFAWIAADDTAHSVLAFVRRGHDEVMLAVCNFTPQSHQAYRIGVPHGGTWRECLNTDSVHYGGGDRGNGGRLDTEAVGAHGHAQSLALTLPPLCTLILRLDG